MSNNSRQNEISMASLYYRCEKYSEIIKIAKELIKENPILSKEELSLFAQGYKCKLNEIRKPLVKLLEKTVFEPVTHSDKILPPSVPALRLLGLSTWTVHLLIRVNTIKKGKNTNVAKAILYS